MDCKEEHKANDRKCRIYQKYIDTNKAVAKDRISIYEAKRRAMEKERDIEERRRIIISEQKTRLDKRSKMEGENDGRRSWNKVVRSRIGREENKGREEKLKEKRIRRKRNSSSERSSEEEERERKEVGRERRENEDILQGMRERRIMKELKSCIKEIISKTLMAIKQEVMDWCEKLEERINTKVKRNRKKIRN